MDPLRRLADDSLRALTGPSAPLPSASATPPASPSPSAAASTEPTATPDAEALASGDCAADVRAFCGPEADVLALLHEVRASVTPARIEAAARGLSLCMARHADALAPRCVEALVADMLGARTAAATARQTGPDDDSSVEISIHYSRHHRGPAAGHALRAGGSALSASHLSANVGHSLLWMLALPFCLLGLFVTAKQGVRYVRRRREERRIECKQQYLPVQ